MGFELATPEIKRLHIFALDRLATGIDARPPCKGQSPGAVSETDRCVVIITPDTFRYDAEILNFSLLAPELFFLILAHSVYKM